MFKAWISESSSYQRTEESMCKRVRAVAEYQSGIEASAWMGSYLGLDCSRLCSPEIVSSMAICSAGVATQKQIAMHAFLVALVYQAGSLSGTMKTRTIMLSTGFESR
mmetsp:Transcript_6123/g.8621  ORF Transcript_6123/g.8621 Transcript_6123/m.8621 type:complete len:107 (-) Transcript_6123:246-566(-)